jgi:hypothetical protein
MITDTLSVMERARKNCPTDAGEKDQRREDDDGGEGGADDGSHQLRRRLLDRVLLAASARWRWMFSTTTTASSMTRPMATARPPIDIRFTVSPKKRMKRKVETMVRGG